MMLKALAEYYDRLPEEKCLPPYGQENVGIAWILALSQEGKFISLQPQITSKNDPLPIYQVSTRPITTSGIESPYFFGKISYVLGIGDKNGKKNADFVDTVNKIANFFRNDTDFQAVQQFYKSPEDVDKAKSAYEREKKNNSFIQENALVAFSIYKPGGHTPLVAEKEELIIYRKHLDEQEQSTLTLCSITGEEGPTTRLHPSVVGNAKLISFQENSVFDSYGKTKGDNAPINKVIADKIAKAFKHLHTSKYNHHKDNRYKIQHIYWISQSREVNDDMIATFVDAVFDDPQDSAEIVKEILKLSNSADSFHSDKEFHIMSYVPGEGRIAVYQWRTGIVEKVFANIWEHHQNLNTINAKGELDEDYPPIYSLSRLLTALEYGKKGDQTRPSSTFIQHILDSIIWRRKYPRLILMRAVQKLSSTILKLPEYHNKSKGKDYNASIDILIGLIKAYHKRNCKISIPMKLDEEFSDQAYVLGRLMRVYQETQERALGYGLNSTVFDKFYRKALTAPQQVFPRNLESLFSAHIGKIRRKNSYLAELLQEKKAKLTDMLPKEKPFPARLTIEERGRFLCGYGHQFLQDKMDQKEQKKKKNED